MTSAGCDSCLIRLCLPPGCRQILAVAFAVVGTCPTPARETVSPAGTGEARRLFATEPADSITLPGSLEENGKGTPSLTRTMIELNHRYTFDGMA
jgi:hypothetical protein